MENGKLSLNQAPLDWLNFFLADVKDGLGPFLAIYLLSTQHWDPGKIGVVMTIAGIATVAARTPFGALIDCDALETRADRYGGRRGRRRRAGDVGLFPSFWVIGAAHRR